MGIACASISILEVKSASTIAGGVFFTGVLSFETTIPYADLSWTASITCVNYLSMRILKWSSVIIGEKLNNAVFLSL